MKKRFKKVPVDVIFPESERKFALARNYTTGEEYVYREGVWVKSLTRYTGDEQHPVDYPRYAGKLSIPVEDHDLKFKDLTEGTMFRLKEDRVGLYYKYYFNRDFNAERVDGQGGRVKIEKDAIISSNK